MNARTIFSAVIIAALSFSHGNSVSAVEKNSSLIYETISGYSHIKIIDVKELRYLCFVRDSGEEVIESAINLNSLHELILGYTQVMFSSFLIKKKQKDCLLIGLGGGGMVHFINYHFPEMNLDIVEIDPVIIDIARKYFRVRLNPHTKIFAEDGFKFLEEKNKTYDVIYMDAFLKPSVETDSTGAPKKLKSKYFYNIIIKKLKPGGLAVFNINHHRTVRADIEDIKNSFPQIYIFSENQYGNIIVIGSMNKKRMRREEIIDNGGRMDKKKQYNFSFERIARLLEE